MRVFDAKARRRLRQQNVQRNREIRKDRAAGLSVEEIAEKYQLAAGTVNGLCRGVDLCVKLPEPGTTRRAIAVHVEDNWWAVLCEVHGASSYQQTRYSQREAICGKCNSDKLQAEAIAHMIGRRFGLWLVLEREPTRTGGSRAYICKCVGCNVEHIVQFTNLKSGRSRCCKLCSNRLRSRIKRGECAITSKYGVVARHISN